MDQVLIQTLDHCPEKFSSVGNHPVCFGGLGDSKARLITLPGNRRHAKQTNETSANPINSIAVRMCMAFFLCVIIAWDEHLSAPFIERLREKNGEF